MLSPRALERRLKRHLRTQPQRYFAACSPGLESILLRELESLPDLDHPTETRGGVSFTGGLDAMYHANLELRTASRILLRIDEFLAQSYPMLYNKASKIPWELYLGFAETYALSVSAKQSRLRHHKRLAETVQSALSSALEPLGLHPLQAKDASVEIHLRMFEDRCTLSLNSSGIHLHKRGYRVETGAAPLRETLAAAVALSADLTSHDLVLDPMCGTGVLLTEAALLARRQAPGLQRTFAFEHFPFFQKKKWERFKAEAWTRVGPAPPIRFIGLDRSAKALSAAKKNAERVGLEDIIHFATGDALSLDYENIKGSARAPLLLSNPPYGSRLATVAEAQSAFQQLRQLVKSAQGWRYRILAPESWRLPTQAETLRFKHGGLGIAVVEG